MKVLLLANTSWYIYNFRLPLARRLQAEGNEVILVSPPDAYTARLREAGFGWIGLRLSRFGLNPVSEMQSILRIIGIYRNERPALVHHFTMKCIVYGSLAALFFPSIRVLNSVTGTGYIFSDARWPKNLLQAIVGASLRLTARRASFIFQNPEDRELFSQHAWTSEASSYLERSSGVNLERFAPAPRPSGTTTLILPSRMLREKGILEFVEAIRLLRSRGIECRAALVGRIDTDSPASLSAEELRPWSDEGLVEWWGWQESMDKAYARAHIVCLPSYYGEGVPMSLVEAAACGLPIVATDMPGCREIVRDHVNGLLVPPRASGALADALQMLIENPELQSRFGTRSREIAAEFSLDRIMNEMMGIYRRVLEEAVAENSSPVRTDTNHGHHADNPK